jgi:hypothetical protein
MRTEIRRFPQIFLCLLLGVRRTLRFCSRGSAVVKSTGRVAGALDPERGQRVRVAELIRPELQQRLATRCCPEFLRTLPHSGKPAWPYKSCRISATNRTGPHRVRPHREPSAAIDFVPIIEARNLIGKRNRTDRPLRGGRRHHRKGRFTKQSREFVWRSCLRSIREADEAANRLSREASIWLVCTSGVCCPEPLNSSFLIDQKNTPAMFAGVEIMMAELWVENQISGGS